MLQTKVNRREKKQLHISNLFIYFGRYIWISRAICHPVRVSSFIQTICPELLNHFKSDLVWWCIFMRRSDMQKNWLIISSVKVTQWGRIHIVRDISDFFCSDSSKSTKFGPYVIYTMLLQFLTGAKMGIPWGCHIGKIQYGRHLG